MKLKMKIWVSLRKSIERVEDTESLALIYTQYVRRLKRPLWLRCNRVQSLTPFPDSSDGDHQSQITFKCGGGIQAAVHILSATWSRQGCLGYCWISKLHRPFSPIVSQESSVNTHRFPYLPTVTKWRPILSCFVYEHESSASFAMSARYDPTANRSPSKL
jgi:hypothetical protein